MVAVSCLISFPSGSLADVSKEPLPGLSVDVTTASPMHRFELGGTAQKTDDAVRLTRDAQGQTGWMFTRQPIEMIGKQWRVDLSLRVSGNGVTLFGDGMALWYTRDKYRPPPDGVPAAFGHDPRFTGLGLFFDTYDNDAVSHAHKHPYVSALVNDGSIRYRHDDAHAAQTEHNHPDLGCHARIRQYGMDQKIVTARLRYDGYKGTMTLHLLYTRDRSFRSRPDYEWTQCFKAENVYLPPGYYLGVSASTGDLSDNHDLVALDVYGEEDAEAAPSPRRSERLPSIGNADHVTDKRKAPSRTPAGGVVPPGEASGSVEEEAMADAAAPVVDADSSSVRGVRGGGGDASGTLVDVADTAASDAAPVAPRSLRAAAAASLVPEATADATGNIAERLSADVPLDDSEKSALSAILAELDVVRDLNAAAASANEDTATLRRNIDARVATLYDRLEQTMRKLQDAEASLEERLARLENRVGSKVDAMVAASEGRAHSWVVPFAMLAIAFVIGGWFWYSRYRRLMKTHML